MVNRLIDIKEDTKIEGQPISEWTLSRRAGSVGMNFDFVIPAIVPGDVLAPGQNVTFREMPGILTSREYRPLPSRATAFSGVSSIGELAKRSPPKTLMYMNMTPAELDDFDISTEDADLDYIPLITMVNPDGTPKLESWDSHKIVKDLIHRAFPDDSVTVVINTYNYYLKQIQASSGSTFLETILSIVSFLRPIIYSDDEEGIIYILDRPLSGTSDVEMNFIENVSERYTFNFESRAKGFYFEGGQGLFRLDKSKLKADHEGETTLVTETYSELPMLETVNIRGEKRTVDKITGTVSYSWGGIGPGPGPLDQVVAQFTFWLKEAMRDKETITEIWRTDPFGNFKALLSRHIVKTCLLPGETQPLTTFDSTETYGYDFLTEEFDKPRLMKKEISTGRFTWMIVDLGGGQGLNLGNARYFKSQVDEISESWAYSPNGLLLQETKTRSADCVRLFGSGPGTDQYVERTLADSVWIPEGGDLLHVERRVVEEEVTKFSQLNDDYYQRATVHRRLGGLPRRVGEEDYSSRTEMIRGHIPRHPISYRKMQVWWGDITSPESHDTYQDVPTVTLSNPNIYHWPDVEQIYNRMKIWAGEADVTERTLTIPADIPIDIGWSFPLSAIQMAGDASIPEVPVKNFQYVSAWSKRETADPPSCVTTITIEGR